MAKKPNQGQQEAHTRADPPAIDAAQAAPGADAELPGADPADLLAGLPDGEGVDQLALVAELVAAPARARGRPAGAPNRKNGDMIRYLAARGHRDPMVTLSMIQSADFAGLCKMLGASGAKQKIAVLGIIRGAAADLMPYHHSRKPQQLDLPPGGGGSNRPIMVIGDGNNVAVLAANGYASAEFLPPDESEGNQGVIDGEAVRQTPDKSHD
jgi:hypothetical protein